MVSNIEIFYVTKSGKALPMLFSGSLMSSGDGKSLGAVCAATDITSRKKTEEALRQANDRLNATLQASPAAIMTLRPDGIVTMWNETAERIFGWKRDEIIGSFDPMVSDEDLVGFQLMRGQVLRGESFFDEEVQRKRKDGTTAYISISTAPLHDARGRISSIMAVMSDITDRKKMEEELQKVQKLESIGTLAGGIAHDFNNILASILGNINLIKMSLGPDHEAYGRLTMVEKASFRATDLTHQLLTFSRGGAPIKKPILISGIIMESAGFSLRGSNVKCEFNLAGDLWPTEADEGQMSQVIRNLVINADQAMPEGGTIRICAENAVLGAKSGLPLKEGSYLKISIEDQGAGIPEEQLKKIFDPYFTTKQEGSGLGLTIVYSIIKNHDGHITVKSTMGAGTVFTLFLPASDKQVPEEKSAAEAPICGKGRILLMDDDVMLREVAGAMLTNIGYEVGFAKDGSEAIALYAGARDSSRPFDAVIMDLTIPGGMGGKEAIIKISAIDPHVKAIVSSGYSQDDIMANFREHGFSAVITKPYKITDLSSTLHKVITGNQRNTP
jgi:PAS domain S-box-containing protein